MPIEPTDYSAIVTGCYLATLAVLGIYGLHRLVLVVHFRWGRRSQAEPVDGDFFPRVAVQLPLFNERTVARRLIRAAGDLDYPPEQLEIQVLDDSSDETQAIVDEEIDRLRRRGLQATVLRREDRTGFKAGALAQGMAASDAELFCVFDADFMPGPEFLRGLVGTFRDPDVGMVQARWGHTNRDESRFTRAQSTLLDGHFVIEHKVRNDSGLFFNFNGTAGIWRREAVEEAGGWQHDTLTEDLDLSYRSQLSGWKFVYAPYVVAPAEVPPGIGAFKSQQHRWAKGSVQVLRKLMGSILSSREPWRVKAEAWAHLTGNVGYPSVLLLSILLPLASGLRRQGFHWWHLAAFLLCTLSVGLFYETSQRAIDRPIRRRLADTVLAMSLGIGMCVGQTRAVFSGMFGSTGTFVRTPKRGDTASARPYRTPLTDLPGIELLFAAWFAWGLISASRLGNWGSLPFLALFFGGFAWVGILSLREQLGRSQEG